MFYSESPDIRLVSEKHSNQGILKGEVSLQLTACLAGLITKTKIVSCHAADSKPVKQEVNGTVILPSLVFPALAY